MYVHKTNIQLICSRGDMSFDFADCHKTHKLNKTLFKIVFPTTVS